MFTNRYWRKRFIHNLALCGLLFFTMGSSFAGFTQGEESIKEKNSVAGPMGWQALPNQGLTGEVNAMVVSGSDLYVGGDFIETGDGSLTDLGNIVRYDIEADIWNKLPNDGLMCETIYSLEVSGNNLFAGGWDITQTGDGSLTDMGNIVRYDIKSKKWHKMPNRGLKGDVWAFAVSGNDVYVGGDFTRTRDGSLTKLGYIVRYDIENDSWHRLPNRKMKGYVRTMLVYDGYLYVGGITSEFNGYVQRFDISSGTWETLTDPVTNAGVWSLAKHNDDLYVGELLGYFYLGYIAIISRYDISTGNWHDVGYEDFNDSISSLTLSKDGLFIGGWFTATNNETLLNLGYLARFDLKTETWQALPNQGLDGFVETVLVVNNDLYVGGSFSETGDGSLKNLGSIARCSLKDTYDGDRSDIGRDCRVFPQYYPIVNK